MTAVDQGLLVLGEPGRAAVLRFVETRYHTRREGIPENLGKLQSALSELFGAGGSILEKLIARALYSEIGLEFETNESWRLFDYVQHAAQEISKDLMEREDKNMRTEAALLLKLMLRSEKSAQLLVFLRSSPEVGRTSTEIARSISAGDEEVEELIGELVELGLMVEQDIDGRRVFTLNTKRDLELQYIMATVLAGYGKSLLGPHSIDGLPEGGLPRGSERTLREAFGDELAEAIISAAEDRARVVVKALGALEQAPIRLREGVEVARIEGTHREARLRKAALKVHSEDGELGER